MEIGNHGEKSLSRPLFLFSNVKPNSLIPKNMITRRSFISRTATLAAAGLVAGTGSILNFGCKPASGTAAVPANPRERYKFALCDVYLLKRQTPGALEIARELGADGVETDMNTLSKNPTFLSNLAKPEFRETYLNKAKELGITISSIGMSAFFAQSFAERESYRQPLVDAIDTAVLMGTRIVFLPFGVYSDITLPERAHLRPQLITRLKEVAAYAQEKGITIGIESHFAAKDEIVLLDEIGSPAVRSYFNFSNPVKHKRDVCAEIKTLGKNRICQIHCTCEDGVWLEKQEGISVPDVKKTLDDIGWTGWLVLERSRDARDARNVRKNFGANLNYLRSVFTPAAQS